MMRQTDVDCGMRIISGTGADPQKECIDCSRTVCFPELNSLITEGESLTVTLEKTDAGFRTVLDTGKHHQEFSVPGVSIIAQKDTDEIRFGFVVSRGVTVRIDHCRCSISEGRFSETPAGTAATHLPDYPLARDLLKGVPVKSYRRKIIVSPDGKPGNRGTHSSPLDLESAVNGGIRSRVILIKDGVYPLHDPLYIGEGQKVRLIAEHPGNVLVEASRIAEAAPALTVRGNGCVVSGLVIAGSPSAGIFVCGSHNRICFCETYGGKDTGILVCAYPGTEEPSWPAYNRIEYCDSHDNCDDARSNADGFGAKLKIGAGNVFYQCFAYSNIDDGFDFYNKRIYSSSKAAKAVSCIACGNGHLPGTEPGKNRGGGFGFKLGGEDVAVPHQADNCLSYANDSFGFSCNSNPRAVFRYCTAFDNGEAGFNLHTEEGKLLDTAPFGLFPPDAVHVNQKPVIVYRESTQTERLFPFLRRDIPDYRCMCRNARTGVRITRREDGSLDTHGLFELKDSARNTGLAGADFSRRKAGEDKVVILVPTLKGGGAERVAADVASHLAETKDVTLLTVSGNQTAEDYGISEKVHVISRDQWLGGSRIAGRTVRTGLRFKHILKKILKGSVLKQARKAAVYPQIQLLRSAKERTGAAYALSFLNSANYMNVMSADGEKTIISVRSYPEGPFAPAELRTEEGRRQMAVSCSRADHIVAVSKETADSLVRTYGADPRRVSVIYNICHTKRILALSREDPGPEFLRFLEDAEFVFFSNARLTNKKGQWHIIRALRKVTETHPDAKLVILGRRGLQPEDTWDLVADMVEAYGLQNNVYMPGFCRNPFSYLAHGDAYVSASFNEGFPNAVVEAMALSLPVISTDCRSGPREILAPSTDCCIKTDTVDYAEYGILIPECSGRKDIGAELDPGETAMAEAMLRIMEDSQLREYYAAQSRKRSGQFTEKAIMKQWRDLLGI